MTAARPSHRFGWCLTGHHADCPVTITHTGGIHTGQAMACLCECHAAETPTEGNK